MSQEAQIGVDANRIIEKLLDRHRLLTRDIVVLEAALEVAQAEIAQLKAAQAEK